MADTDPSSWFDQLKSLPRNIWVTTLTSFLTDISSEMIFNLLPLFLANVLGVSTSVIGLIEGIAETTSSLLKVFSGWVSDKIQNRKWLAVTGYGLSAVAKPFLYFATSWLGVLLVRFADRTGKGIRTAPRDALIANSIEEEHRGIAFGLHRAGDTAGAMLGLIIALGVVLATQTDALALNRASFQAIVLVSIIPALVAVLVLAWGAQDTKPQIVKAEKPKSADEPAKLNLSFGALNSEFKFFLFIMAVFTLGNSSDAFLILRAQERGLTVVGVLGMLISFSLIYTLFSSPLGALSDRVGRHRLIIGGWLGYGLLDLGFGFATSATQIWMIYGLYGLYYAAVEGTAKALVADLIPKAQRGTAYGYFNATIGLMAFPASLSAGILWQGVGSWAGFGASAPFFFGAILALLASCLMILHARQYPRKTIKAETTQA